MMQKGIPNFINPTDMKEGVPFLEEAIVLLNLALIKQAKDEQGYNCKPWQFFLSDNITHSLFFTIV